MTAAAIWRSTGHGFSKDRACAEFMMVRATLVLPRAE
jgi:hypothetical protein